jgi:type II secretory pathway pseudopilin PulG
MAVPLSIAIIALTALLGLVTWLYVRAQAENARLVERILEINTQYSEYTLKSAEKMTRDLPKMSEKMLDSLARGISEVTKGTSDAMQAIYGPVRVTEQAQTAELGDLPTPWYAEEGALDTSDPTDRWLVSDPTEYPEGGSNLIMDGDDEPFGIPGLKVGGDA